jgi:glucosamine--fructose-6-phosphate aminotransferase (isomerizing)
MARLKRPYQEETSDMSSVPPDSAFAADILAQPECLRQLNLQDLAEIIGPLGAEIGSFRRLVLTGMGASHAALRPLWLTLVGKGQQAWLVESSELLASFLPLVDSSTLVIAASQSGRSAELVALAGEIGSRGGRLLAITNDVESPLAREAHAIIDIRAGEENAVSTKTYVNTLAAGLALGRLVNQQPLGDVLHHTANALENYLQKWRAHVGALKAEIGLPERLYFLGRGTSMSAAECGALITKEAAKWPVEAQSAAQFRHGPLELADERLSVVLLAGADDRTRSLNKTLEQDLVAYGARAFRLDSGSPTAALDIPETANDARPLVEIVPLQLLSIAIAEQSGLVPGVFRHLNKVTTVL